MRSIAAAEAAERRRSYGGSVGVDRYGFFASFRPPFGVVGAVFHRKPRVLHGQNGARP
jgi:hypothetical protein